MFAYRSVAFMNMNAICGDALVVDPAYRGLGYGSMLRAMPSRMNVDYVWGSQLKALNNIDDWLKRRLLVTDSQMCNVTIELISEASKEAYADLGRLKEEYEQQMAANFSKISEFYGSFFRKNTESVITYEDDESDPIKVALTNSANKLLDSIHLIDTGNFDNAELADVDYWQARSNYEEIATPETILDLLEEIRQLKEENLFLAEENKELSTRLEISNAYDEEDIDLEDDEYRFVGNNLIDLEFYR